MLFYLDFPTQIFSTITLLAILVPILVVAAIVVIIVLVVKKHGK